MNKSTICSFYSFLYIRHHHCRVVVLLFGTKTNVLSHVFKAIYKTIYFVHTQNLYGCCSKCKVYAEYFNIQKKFNDVI